MSWLISLTCLCLILSIINLTLSVVKQKLGKTLFWIALCFININCLVTQLYKYIP